MSDDTKQLLKDASLMLTLQINKPVAKRDWNMVSSARNFIDEFIEEQKNDEKVK